MEPPDDSPAPFPARQAVELPGVHEHAVFGHDRERPRRLGPDHGPNRELERRRELEVAPVVGRHGHDRARAVFHQDVVGDPDGDRLAGRRIARVGPEEDAGLGPVAHFARHDVCGLHLAPVGVHRATLLIGRERFHERVLRREHQVGRAEHGVGPRREHADLLAARRLEHELGALAPPDPVALQRPGGLRPIEPVEIREQAFGVPGDREEPLLEEALLDFRVGMALAVAVDHLLVGHDAHVLGTPVHRRLLAQRQPRLEELDEDPLGPLVVPRVRGGQLVAPVEHAAEATQLVAEPVDVLGDQLRGVGADLERIVLGVDPERVEPDRLEHGVPLEPPEPPVDVGARESEHVPHV